MFKKNRGHTATTNSWGQNKSIGSNLPVFILKRARLNISRKLLEIQENTEKCRLLFGGEHFFKAMEYVKV